MKAVVFEEFGGSDKLKIDDVPLREVRAGEVRVQIAFTSVNPVDWKIREGYLQDMLTHQFPISCGWDAAGTVSAVADDVESFKVGDRVMAYTRLPKVHAGTYAEFINLPESYLTKVPEGLELSEAAAMPLVGLTAYQALHNLLKIDSGQSILITAGAGGVGSFAIQFAKAAGLNVTATASAKNHAYLQELGVDHAVDYTAGDAVEQLRNIEPEGFPVVLDGAGGESLVQAIGLTAQNGRLVSIVETPNVNAAHRPDVTAQFHFVEPSGTQLGEIAGLWKAGKVRSPHIELKSVKEAASAQDENQERRVRGKVVLAIDFS